MHKVLFVDRDGTLIEEPPDQQVDCLDKIRLVAGVIPALLQLRDAGFRFVMVTNQDGLGTDSFPLEHFERCQEHILSLFRSQGIRFDPILICPHRENEGCACRKPRSGLLTPFLAHTSLDLERCAVVGDRQTDVQLAASIGVRGFLLDPAGGHENSWPGIVEALATPDRLASFERQTRETSIRVTVNLDIDAPISIHTGIGFFDHMLEQVAKHGGFSLRLECSGDLDVDEHHTVEDTAICLGNAMRRALGEKHGIGRYGFLLPMDESEAKVSLDLSGRGWLEFDGEFRRESVGGLPTELVPHFFRSFAEALGAALHIEVRGENAHHMVEACFKGVGRSLRRAIRRDGDAIPSTKGDLH
ncbi:MAG: bifunctional histidinol-phosphatase/imidazoleglycerol-phosphate dehydratase HisB [Woeseia sp.]